MATTEDTEITLGTGKMLALFFGLVALCALFFGIGFSLGKSSAKSGSDAVTGTAAPGAVRPTAVKSNNPRPPSDLTFYKAVGQKDPDAQLTASSADAPSSASAAPKSAPADSNAPPDLTAVSPQSAYYVQVAAVSKQEDAGALVDALKKKQYAAFAANTPGDKLFHVQVGPFSDIKDAELARGKLVSDGYNPILKK
jgi:cell division septation protein DedD